MTSTDRVLGMGQASNASTYSTTAKTSSGTDFGKVMSQSLASNSKTSISDYSSSKSDSKVSTAEKSNTDTKSGVDAGRTTKANLDEDKNVNKKLDESDKSAASSMNDIDDSKVKEVLDSIKEQIKKIFGVTDEELESVMANLGITIQDLLMPNNLTNLVAEITGTQDALTLLTDSELSSQLKSLMDYVDTQVNNLAEEINVSGEDIKAYIENLAMQDDTTEGNAVKTALADDSVVDENSAKSPLVTEVDDSGDLQEVISSKLTVSGEAGSNNTNNEMSGNSMFDDSEAANDNGDMFTNVTNNLTQNIENAFQNINVDSVEEINTADVIRQIVDAVKVTVSSELSSMEIQLNPENLGKINLTVVAKDGAITAQLAAENETVKKAIENQLQTLKETLNSQGIKVDAVEVTIASHSFEGNQNLNKGSSSEEENKKKSSGSLKLDSLDDLTDDELSDEERRVRDMLTNGNSSVEYTA